VAMQNLLLERCGYEFECDNIKVLLLLKDGSKEF